jgi:hypothetical protein
MPPLLRHNGDMRVSVIATVFNERASIERLLDSLAAQTRRPDEVVICDGGSRDGTAAFIARLCPAPPGAAARSARDRGAGRQHQPRAQRCHRRRAGADYRRHRCGRAAGGRPGWSGWSNPGRAIRRGAAGGGRHVHAGRAGRLPDAMAATVLPLRGDRPAALSAQQSVGGLHKTAWAQAGGYPNGWTTARICSSTLPSTHSAPDQSERLCLGAGGAGSFSSPAESLRSFWTQYYRYARGDGKADLWRKRHAIRYVTYLVALPALLGHAWFGFFARWLGWAGACWRASCSTAGDPGSGCACLAPRPHAGAMAGRRRARPGDPRHGRPGENVRATRSGWRGIDASAQRFPTGRAI